MRAYVLTERPLSAPILTGVATRSGMPEAIDVERAARLAGWYLPDATELAAAAKHGLLLETEEKGIAGALALTQAAQAVLAQPGTTGALVLFDSGSVLHAQDGFSEQAVDAALDDPPVFLWVAFEVTEHDDETRSLYTHGAVALGAPMEIEVERSRRSAEDLLERAADAVLVALSAGSEVEDGDTIELSEDTVRVRFHPSLRGTGERTWRLRIP